MAIHFLSGKHETGHLCGQTNEYGAHRPIALAGEFYQPQDRVKANA
jgi:hypothetical protein